jgi:hypothetical protein
MHGKVVTVVCNERLVGFDIAAELLYCFLQFFLVRRAFFQHLQIVIHVIDPLQGVQMSQEVVFLSVGGNTVREITKNWKMSARDWSAAKTQFAIVFGDRFEVNH